MVELPSQFVSMIEALPGHGDVINALSCTESPVAVRLNPFKPSDIILPPNVCRVPWEPTAIYLSNRPQFTFHTGLYDGRFYVQDPSSMIIGEVVRRIVAQEGEIPLCYLDACAAPGGKTLSALTNLPDGSFVLANEFDGSRIMALIDNIHRWGKSGYAISRADACTLGSIGEMFEVVAADVPCSGEGMMRKNQTAITQWSPGLIRDCSNLQRRIVSAVWKTLRPGGYFIYSTCTFNTAENEENVRWMRNSLGATPVDMGLTEFQGTISTLDPELPGARMLPGHVDGEGQFVAVLRKNGTLKKMEKKEAKPSKFEWLDGNFVTLLNKKGEIYAIDTRHFDFVKKLMAKTNIIVPGIHVSSPKGHDSMPAQALATSLDLKKNVLPIEEVDYPTAIDFLRGQAFQLDSSVPKGYVLISHGGNHLGWVKNLGSRANNLFPEGLRIRLSQRPDSEPDFQLKNSHEI